MRVVVSEIERGCRLPCRTVRLLVWGVVVSYSGCLVPGGLERLGAPLTSEVTWAGGQAAGGQRESEPSSEPRAEPVQRLMALPPRPTPPADNPTTEDKVALGKWLFFDPRLSGDNKMSCATCHLPDKAFADGLARSTGAEGKPLGRNTQSCLNVGFLPSLFWDGRAASLEEQALGPIRSPLEMRQDLDELERELADVPAYVEAFRRVFDAPPNRRDLARALAAFQRTLNTGTTPVDRYLAGDRQALSPAARRGLKLFEGAAGCVRCHHGPMLTDGKFYRLGVGYGDLGRFEATGREEDRYRFRTPSLRNVAETGPYMHDGSLQTLDEVVSFYFREVPETGPRGLKLDVRPLNDLSFAEISDLVAFLKSLSGELPRVAPPQLP